MRKGISYVAVAHDSNILAQCALGDGDFDVTIHEILSKVKISEQKIQFDVSEHRFFLLHDENGLNIVVACSPQSSQDEAFIFLEKIKQNFLTNFPAWQSAAAYSLQSNFETQLRSLADSATKICENNEEEEIEKIEMDALEKSILTATSEDYAQINKDRTKRFDYMASLTKMKVAVKEYWPFFLGVIIIVLVIFIIVCSI